MGIVTEARRVLESLPPDARARVEGLGGWIPRAYLYGSTFRRTRSLLQRSQWWSEEEHRRHRDASVADLVRYVHEQVPYYRRIMRERGLRPEDVSTTQSLRRMPIIDKETVRAHLDEFVPEDVPANRRELVSTGGSTAEPLKLWLARDRSSVEWAFLTHLWERVGYRLGDRRAVLRGWVPPEPEARLWETHPLLDEIVLSTFHLSKASAPRYLQAMRDYEAEFLQAYPSSAEALCREIARSPSLAAPRFRAVLLSSELLLGAQRRFIEETLETRCFSYYGQTEKCLLAAECERSEEFHVSTEYGWLELLDERGEPVGPGEQGVLVGTSFVNRVTPLIRYRTDDLGLAAEGPCECGRSYPRLACIEGRRGELLVGARGRPVSIAALNTHTTAFETVRKFRVLQERPGEATLLLVPGEGFDEGTAERCASEYERRSGGEIRFVARVVDELPLTARGKFQFVDQRLDLGAELAGSAAPGPLETGGPEPRERA